MLGPINFKGTSIFPSFINVSGGAFNAGRASARYISGFTRALRPKPAPHVIQPWVNETIGGGIGKRNLRAEGDRLSKMVFEPGLENMPGDYFGCRSTKTFDHSWFLARFGNSNVMQWNEGAEARNAWMKVNALSSMITTLLENGCALIPDDYARKRATLNSKSITYGYEQKYGMNPSIKGQASELYRNIAKGVAASLGNNMIRTATDVEEIDLPGGGKMWGVINAVTSDHAFSGSLTWWRGYEAQGKPFTIVYGGGGDLIPVIQPNLNVYGGEMLFAQSNDIWDLMCRPENTDLRSEDFSTFAWNQDLKDKVWYQLDPTTQNVRLILDMCDGLGTPIKLLKRPAKFALRVWGSNVPDNKYWEIEEFLSKRLKTAFDKKTTADFSIPDEADRKAVATEITDEFTSQLLGETNQTINQLVKQLNAELENNPPSEQMEDIVRKVMEVKGNLNESNVRSSLVSLEQLATQLQKLDYAHSGEFQTEEVTTLDLVNSTTQKLTEIIKSIEVFERQQNDPDASPDPIEPIEDPASEEPKPPDASIGKH